MIPMKASTNGSHHDDPTEPTINSDSIANDQRDSSSESSMEYLPEVDNHEFVLDHDFERNYTEDDAEEVPNIEFPRQAPTGDLARALNENRAIAVAEDPFEIIAGGKDRKSIKNHHSKILCLLTMTY